MEKETKGEYEDPMVGKMKSPEYVGKKKADSLAGRKCGEGGAPDEECGERDGGAESAFGSIYIREETPIGEKK